MRAGLLTTGLRPVAIEIAWVLLKHIECTSYLEKHGH